MFDESQKTRSKEKRKMKKTYKIEVDCANCANKMEDAAKNTAGVQKNCKKVEDDCEIYL